MDKIRSYTESDYYDIVNWFQKRGMLAPSRYDLPQIGFIVPDLAAGFLIQTDTKTAIIDFLISNKESNSVRRNNAISIVARTLISKAKSSGFHYVKCDSQIDTIKKRALALGFKDLGNFSVFIKEFDHG